MTQFNLHLKITGSLCVTKFSNSQKKTEHEEARQTLSIQGHLTVPAISSNAKLRQKKTYKHTKPVLVSCYKLRSQAQTHDRASWCVAMATAVQGGEKIQDTRC